MEQIEHAFALYASLQERIEEIKSEIPELALLEKEAEAAKKEIQDWAKSQDGYEMSSCGYEVKLSERDIWDTKAFPGAAAIYPALWELCHKTKVAAVKKAK